MLLWATPAAAQQNAPANPCKTDESFKAFDFIIGDWEVVPIKDAAAGHLKVTYDINECAIISKWIGTHGFTGHNVIFYNRVNKKWKNIWISLGYSSEVEGEIQNGSMVMSGLEHSYRRLENTSVREKWTPNEDGSVHHISEKWNTETNKWEPVFERKFVRAKARFPI